MARKSKQSEPDPGLGLPMTGAELDALQGDARADAEQERAALMAEAVDAANAADLPKLGGELPESERGPIEEASTPDNDPQQKAIEEAVAAIDWSTVTGAEAGEPA